MYHFHLNLITGLLFVIFLFHCKQKTVEDAIARPQAWTPLDEYINTSDPNFHYEIMHQSKIEGYTLYVVKMISQEWLTTLEVDEPTWWHWITVVVPDTIQYHTALMWIGGGAKDDELPQEAGTIILESALLTHSVSAEIHNIPNQPLTFVGDTINGRYEDELIAFGWRQFLERGATDEDAIWLARLPMTKAVVRAMDVVKELIASEFNHSIDHYVVSGASKRGWTTWTTAAVDDRVIAIIPVVIDLLNVVPSFDHHWRNYGFWAPAVSDYVTEGIMDWMHSIEFARLIGITEPYSYIERFDLPKLLINATGDQFFQPDSWQFYWDDLIGEKHVRYVPNTGHSLRGTDAIETLVAFYQHVVEENDRPEYQWEIRDSIIHVEVDPENQPSSIKLWYAINEEARDFRIDITGEIWIDSTLALHPEGIYEVKLSQPISGWKAYFIELTYPGDVPLKVTTGVTVLPKIYPYEAFVNEDAKGIQSF